MPGLALRGGDFLRRTAQGQQLEGRSASAPLGQARLRQTQRPTSFATNSSRAKCCAWEVEHRAQIRTTVAGTTQTAETTSVSVKVWKINAVDPQGNATFEHIVESVDMRQKLTGRQEVRYNSRTDREVPGGFQDVAKNVGVTLSEITIDRQGKIIKREDKQQQPASPTTHMTVPLPDNPVAIGEHWVVPYDVTATGKDGSNRIVKMRQQVTLEEVTGGVATLDVEAQVLSPVRDPTVEAQLVQSELNGKVRFDIASGRVLSQKNNSDKHVVGYQGATSSMHYVAQFAETLLGDPKRTAAKPKIAGPLPPKSAGNSAGRGSHACTAVGACRASRQTEHTPPDQVTLGVQPQSDSVFQVGKHEPDVQAGE